MDFYNNSYAEIISETVFEFAINPAKKDTDYLIFSEKIFKPIYCCQPFILSGNPFSLKKLKEFGFKTFDKWWDESYDNIVDNSERILAVYKLVKSLVSKTNEEWDELNKKLLPILEYNREHLLSFTEEKVGNTYVENLNKLIEHEPNTKNYFLF